MFNLYSVIPLLKYLELPSGISSVFSTTVPIYPFIESTPPVVNSIQLALIVYKVAIKTYYKPISVAIYLSPIIGVFVG